LSRFQLAFLILHAPSNRLADLLPLVPNVLNALSAIRIGDVVHIGNHP
jgi:hypothetical protein